VGNFCYCFSLERLKQKHAWTWFSLRY